MSPSVRIGGEFRAYQPVQGYGVTGGELAGVGPEPELFVLKRPIHGHNRAAKDNAGVPVMSGRDGTGFLDSLLRCNRLGSAGDLPRQEGAASR